MSRSILLVLVLLLFALPAASQVTQSVLPSTAITADRGTNQAIRRAGDRGLQFYVEVTALDGRMATGTSVTFDQIGAANDEIVCTNCNWTTLGFSATDQITVSGSTSNDAGSPYTIAAISTTTTTDDTLEFAGDVLTDEVGTTAAQIYLASGAETLTTSVQAWNGGAWMTMGTAAAALTQTGTVVYTVGLEDLDAESSITESFVVGAPPRLRLWLDLGQDNGATVRVGANPY
jgi:hypothetical protein